MFASMITLQCLGSLARKGPIGFEASAALAARIHLASEGQDGPPTNAPAPEPGPASASTGMIEVREYTLHPGGFKAFMATAQEYANLRKELLPFLGMFTPEAGGTLNRVVHFYHWKDFDERDARRVLSSRNKWWVRYLEESRQHIQTWESTMYTEAAPVYEALGLTSAANFTSPWSRQISDAGPGMITYELRTTQLQPGYTSVPQLLSAFSKGLPPKVAADPSGLLVFCGHTEFGTLNKVVELWRYPSAQACLRVRQASRAVPEWRDTVASIAPGVQSFTTTLLRPASFSNWQ